MSSRDLLSCFIELGPTTSNFIALRNELEKQPGYCDVAKGNKAFSARHVIRPLSSWLSISSSGDDDNENNAGHIHMLTFHLNGGKSDFIFLRQNMLLSDVFVVSLGQSDSSTFPQWLKELTLMLQIAASHRSAISVAAPHVVVHAAPGASSDTLQLLTKTLQGNGIAHSVCRSSEDEDADKNNNETQQAAVAAKTVARLHELFAERYAAKQQHVDPGAPSSSSLCLFALGATDTPRVSLSPSASCTVIARAARAGSIDLGRTLLCHDPANPGSVYSITGAWQQLPALKTKDDLHSARKQQQGTVSYREGDVLLLEIVCPEVRHKTDGSFIYPFAETQVTLCDAASNSSWSHPRCQQRPFCFFELPSNTLDAEQAQQQQQLDAPNLLAPRFLFANVHDPDVRPLLNFATLPEREFLLVGFGGTAKAHVVYSNSTTGDVVLACTRNGKNGELFVLPELGGGGGDDKKQNNHNKSVTLIAHIPVDAGTATIAQVTVNAALRATDMTSSLLDLLLDTNNNNKDGSIFMSDIARHASRRASWPNNWLSLAPRVLDNPGNNKTQKQRVVWFQELLTDTTLLFAYRRTDVLRVCRPHAALALTDLHDVGVLFRTFVSLATSLNSRAKIIALCDPLVSEEVGLKKLLHTATRADHHLSFFPSHERAQCIQDAIGWPEPIRTVMCAQQSGRRAFEQKVQVISVMLGHCCTSRWTFEVMDIQALVDGLSLEAVALQSGHFVLFQQKRWASAEERIANPTKPPCSNRNSEFGGALLREEGPFEQLRVQFGNIPQLLGRAQIMTRLVGGSHWSMITPEKMTSLVWYLPAAAKNKSNNKQPPGRRSTATSCTKEQLQYYDQHNSSITCQMARNIFFWTQRWAALLPSGEQGDLVARLPAIYALFYVQLMQLKSKKEQQQQQQQQGDSIFLLSEHLLLHCMSFLVVTKPGWVTY